MALQIHQNPKIQGRLVEAQVAKEARLTEMGILGVLFGGTEEKPGNIAGLAFVVSAILFALIYFFGPSTDDFPKSAALSLVGSVLTGSVGYLFGRGSS